ncbi:hypothetical protein ACFE04_003372 [Oxalis oulophora]
MALSCYDLPSDRINQWIQQAINSNVQILTLNFGHCNKYTVPQCVLTGKTSLKKLSLTDIKLSDHLPNNLFTNLEDLNLFWCYGLKVIDISDPTKLKKLVVMARNLEYVHIEALSLIELLLGGKTIKTVDIRHCKNLRLITIYRAAVVKTCWLDEVMSYCTSLETLNLNACQSLDVAKISSTSLKSLKILYCYSLDAIELNCPNLSEFTYCGVIVDLLSNVSASASFSKDETSYEDESSAAVDQLDPFSKKLSKICFRKENVVIDQCENSPNF